MEPSCHLTPAAHLSCPTISHDQHLNEDLDDSLQHIIMAVDVQQRKKLGCAYYMTKEQKLCAMEDVADATPDLLARCKPHTFLEMELTCAK